MTVNGTLVDNIGAPIANMKVMIGSTIVTTDASGNFTIADVIEPYDVKIFQSALISQGVMFKGLTTETPVLVFPSFPGSQNTAMLTVNIPAMTVGQRAFVIFTNENNVQEQGIIIPPNISSNFTVRWQGSASISGKVIVFITDFSAGLVQSYENYGEKSQSLTNGGSFTTTFTTGEVALNPGEANISGALNVPSGYTAPSTALLVNYKQGGGLIYPFNAGASLSDAAGLNFDFVVPTGLPTSFRFILAGSAYGVNLREYTSKCSITSSGTSNNTVSPETFSVLSAPANNSQNINLNSTISAGIGSGSGVNLFTFDGPDRVFYVVTTESSVNMPDFSALGLGIGSSLIYDWSVVKFGAVSGMDEFVSGNFYNNQNLVFYSSSAEWKFTTAP
jgi:hypothetical protein